MDTLKVRDAKDVEEVVRAAIANEQPLEIIGHGSKRSIGHAMATNAALDVSALNAVTSYEPNELIVTLEAGAPLADVLSLIDAKNQQFAFEPMNTAPLLGTPVSGTIGGMIAAGLAGPRRIRAGGARDHLLGAHAVSGFGDSFKTGGKVVKNVTGYDLCKLLAGSWGTLSVMTEVTLKVMPKPEAERTLLLRGLDDAAANKAMTAALGSPFDVSGAAHLPKSAFRAKIDGLGDIAGQGEALTVLRLEGITASGRPPRRFAARIAGAVRNRGPGRGRIVGGTVGDRPRRPAVRGRRRAGRPAGVADRLSAGVRCGARDPAGARDRRRRDLRLGRRIDLGRTAAEGRRA
ncbi:FAD/FMN-containing dehydrogenase [Bradyrhizobium diazoefficiens]